MKLLKRIVVMATWGALGALLAALAAERFLAESPTPAAP